MYKKAIGALIAVALSTANAWAIGLVFFDNFNAYTGTPNALQYQTYRQVYYAGSLPNWVSSGFHAVHAVDLSSGEYAPMIYGDNTLTTTSSILANRYGVQYLVSFKVGAAVYNYDAQATTNADGIVVEVIKADGSVLAQATAMPSGWLYNYDWTVRAVPMRPYELWYTGDGSGSGYVKFRIRNLRPAANTFGGMIDNFEVTAF